MKRTTRLAIIVPRRSILDRLRDRQRRMAWERAIPDSAERAEAITAAWYAQDCPPDGPEVQR